MSGTSATLLARRWESALLVNVDNATLQRLMGNEAAIKGLVELFGHSDLEVRNEALSAVDAIAVNGSEIAVKKINDLEAAEAGRSIWNNFKREALPTRSRLQTRAASS